MTVSFLSVHLGDQNLKVRGWLVLSQGAVRGIMSEFPDGSIHYGYACDQRVAPVEGYMVFCDLVHASTWFGERLAN
jgi:hypothetical protein